MGLEFINKTSKSFTRSVAKGRVEIEIPGLCDPEVSATRQAFRARFGEGGDLPVGGTTVYVRADGDEVRILDTSERVIAKPVEPPGWLIERLRASPSRTLLGAVGETSVIGRTGSISL